MENRKKIPLRAEMPPPVIAVIQPAQADRRVLEEIRQRRKKYPIWAVYQNHDMMHSKMGDLVFLAVGPGATFRTPPDRAPDSNSYGFGWRYLFCGHNEIALVLTIFVIYNNNYFTVLKGQNSFLYGVKTHFYHLYDLVVDDE